MKTVAIKIVILGSQGVGKTSLVTRYETNNFTTSTSSTIGASFSSVEVLTDGVKVKMQVWDTAGQERFRSMAPMYYRGANAALLVFDLTNFDTFTDVKTWVHELKSRVEGKLMLLLVGNKTDLVEERVVETAIAQKYSTSIDAKYFETSALDNTGVQELFNVVAVNMIQKARSNTDLSLRVYSSEGKNEWEDNDEPNIKLEESMGQRKSNNCCW